MCVWLVFGIFFCSANYLKPGRTLRRGKIGLDFFNGEDSLLAYVKADKELCARLNISNIMVRTQVGPSESSAPNEPSRRCRLLFEVIAVHTNYFYAYRIPGVVCVTHACNDTQTAPSHREESTEGEKGEHGQSCKKTAKKASSKPKNKTKKQLAYEAAERRRKLSSFSKGWGDSNAEGICANDLPEEQVLSGRLQLGMDLLSRHQLSQQQPSS
ncbi:hypothetical protein PF008_g5363 [Phytophthora fragariae]|uniref:ZP domain-containing protein n=1 Tax=Phytophthora fragariae TaxID=53985 RepID=A0A6G0S9M1_9STRA|nr:hypothetical protein PF008_g5363 [Phytophthora fragariae]